MHNEHAHSVDSEFSFNLVMYQIFQSIKNLYFYLMSMAIHIHSIITGSINNLCLKWKIYFRIQLNTMQTTWKCLKKKEVLWRESSHSMAFIHIQCLESNLHRSLFMKLMFACDCVFFVDIFLVIFRITSYSTISKKRRSRILFY